MSSEVDQVFGPVEVKFRSSFGQVLVKFWSSSGQVLIKFWLCSGQAMVSGQVLVKSRSTIGTKPWSDCGQVAVR